MRTTSLLALIWALNCLSAENFTFFILTDSTDSSKMIPENLRLGAERVTKQSFAECELIGAALEERPVTLGKTKKSDNRMCRTIQCELKPGETKKWTYNAFEYNEFFGLVEEEKAQLPAILWVFIALTIICFIIGFLYCSGCICKSELLDSMSDDEIPEENTKTTSFNLHIDIDEKEFSRGEFSTGEYENALLNMKGITQMQEDFDAKMRDSTHSSSTVVITPSAVPDVRGQINLAQENTNEPNNHPEEQKKIEPKILDKVDSIHNTISLIADIFHESDDRSSSIFSTAGK